jgi:hypothetical protein
LQTNFGVGGMPISIDTTEAIPGVTWQAPRDAEYIACAMFSCRPSFAIIGRSPTSRDELKQISNFAQCVLLFSTAPANRSVLTLGLETLYEERVICDRGDAGRLITELALGCWAYDATSVVAASDLIHVRGSVLSYVREIPHEDACATDGAACYDAVADLFGVCRGGSCRQRCRTSVDCAARDDSPPADGCAWSCEPVAGSSLGACARAIPAAPRRS